MKVKNILTFILSLFSVLAADAQGFRMNNMGVKATAMGGYNCGLGRDASAVFFNPAAITHFENRTITIGFNAVLPRISYLDPYEGNVDMDPALSVPIHAYGITKLKGKFSAGVALYTPFSENTKWGDEWSGRYITIDYRVRSMHLQPVVAYAVNDKFSVGAGPVLSWVGIRNKYALDATGTATAFGTAEEKGASTAIGFTAALNYKLEKISFGAAYRSSMKHSIKNGDVEYGDLPDGFDILESYASASSFNTELNLPSTVDAGLAWDLNDNLQFSFNLSYTMWSENKENIYEYPGNTDYNRTLKLESEDALSFAMGGRYKYTEKVTFRAGIGITKSHVPDKYVYPQHPDADQFIYSGGLTWKVKDNIDMDFALMVRDYKSRKEGANVPYNFNGDYKGTLYITGIGINYAF